MDGLRVDDWHSSSASDSSHDSSGFHLITEEDLLDSLFFTCDVNKNKKVPVSKLIETLRFTTGLSNEDPTYDHLEDLCRLLDPQGQDIQVDLATYRKAMSHWIQAVREKNCFESHEDNIEEEFPRFFTCERALSPQYDKIVQYLKMPSASNSPESITDMYQSGRGAGTTYLEGSGCGGMEESPIQVDVTDLLNRVTNLQLSNQKLAEENSKLRSERETADDLMLQTNQVVEDLKKTIRSHQMTVDHVSELRKENDDLKGLVESLEECRRMSEMKHCDLNKENRSLEQNITELQEELHEVSTKLSVVLDEQGCLHSSFVQQKQKRTEAEQLRQLQMTQLLEKSGQLEQLQTIVSDLGRKNEYMREEKSNLEQQLAQTQQQLTTMQARVGLLGVAEASDDESDDEELMPVKLIPVASSTPCHGLSIGSEMKTSIVDDPMLPSPLCDKEFEEMLKECQPGEFDRSIDGITLSPSVALRYSAKAFTDTLEFREKKDLIMQHINELSRLVPLHQRTLCTGLRKLNDLLKTDMTAFVKEITSQTMTKLAFKRRIKKLIKTLVLLKNENKQMREMSEKVTQKMVEECDSRVDALTKTISLLESESKQQAQCSEKLQQGVEETRQQLEEVMAELVSKTERVAQVESMSRTLQQQVDELQSTNMELMEKYEKSEEKVTNLEEELESSSTECSLERQKSTYLQESLATTCLQRQQDMKELWRLVQADIDVDDTSTDSQESGVTASTELLREQVVQEMQSLRMQLARSQIALASLEARPLPLGFCCSDQNYDFRNNNEARPDSPLIEALTLDLDHLMRNRVTDKWQQGSSSTEDFGDDVACSEADSFWEERPELMTPCLLCRAAHLVNTSTQTDDDRMCRPQLADSRYAAVNTSTGSSTSGIDVSSCSVRSELSSGSVYKRAHAVEPPRTPDSFSSTDEEQSCMQRTPSFRLAIELSLDYAARSIDSCDGDSTVTSPDLTPISTETPTYPMTDDVGTCLECGSQSCDCSQVVSHHESDATLESDQCLDGHTIVETEESPILVQNRLRKLSTLVEEGSEVDPEDLVGTTTACRKIQCSQVALPQYKCPPAYQPVSSSASTNRETLRGESKLSDGGLGTVEWSPLMKQKTEETGDREQKMEVKTATMTDLQRTPSFEETESPEKDSPTGSRDGQSSQSAVVQTSKLTSAQTSGETSDVPQKMPLKRTTKTDLQRTPSFEMDGEEPGSAQWHSDTLARDAKYSPSSSTETEAPKLRTSQSCTSLEQVLEMSSDGYSSMATAAPLGGEKADTASAVHSDVQYSSQQLEERFRDLALRFKANKVKLEERAKQHQHKRDVSEGNINRELADLQKLLLKSVTSSDAEVHVLCTRLRQHVSVLEQTSRQLASRCEEHGAVQQELRESSEVDMMIQYVENLKREYENLKHTCSIATTPNAVARQRARDKKVLPRRATMQTISTLSYQQPAKLGTPKSLSKLQEEKLRVTGKALRRAVSCFPSMSTKQLKEMAKEQDTLARLSGDVDDTGDTDDAGDAVLTARLESVEEVEPQETAASNGSVSDGRMSPDGIHNRRYLVKRKAVRQFSDHTDPPTRVEEPEPLCDDCVTSLSQVADRSSHAQRLASWLAPWRCRGTLLQKLRYIFSCLTFVCGVITFIFVFLPTRKALKMDSNAQTMEVDDILKPYTSLRHHAAPPV